MYCQLNVKSKIFDYNVNFIDSIKYIEESLTRENIIIIIDETVSKLYNCLNNENNIIIKSNEDAKTIVGIQYLLDELIKRKANIKTKLIAIGGGVLQDLVGFCASIYCRGIDYIFIPTTLLAQTDSCIGGKTSINYKSRKNILGTFFPPKEILIYTDFLKTLNRLDYISGLGEIYKFHILQGKISQFNIDNDIKTMIIDSLKYKINILSIDEFDKNERKFLNYGHTFGHALESISTHKIPHGIAVIIGSMIATEIAYNMNYNLKNYNLIMNKGVELITESGITLKKEWFDLNELLNITKSDKKSTGQLTMVLVDDKPFLENIKNIFILKNILNKIYESF